MSVAPYTGAWIEIRRFDIPLRTLEVAPYTGAWIEINYQSCSLFLQVVAPYTGAWIEIVITYYHCFTQYRRTLHGCVD